MRFLKILWRYLTPSKEMSYGYKTTRIYHHIRWKVVKTLNPQHKMDTKAFILRNRGDPRLELNRTRTKNSENVLGMYVDYIMDRFPDIKDSRVLDVGARDGVFLELLANRGVKILDGIEVVPEWEEYCKGIGIKWVRTGNLLVEGTVSPESYDFVFSRHVIEHVDRPVEFFSCLKNAMAKNGILFLVFPLNNRPNFKHPAYLPSIEYVKQNFDWDGLEVREFCSLDDFDAEDIDGMREPGEDHEVIVIAQKTA